MSKNKKTTPEIREPRCGHKGNWGGVGQSAVVDKSGIIVIATTVCGECGDVAISVNNMKAQQAPPERNNIVVPKIDIGPKKK